MYDYAGPPSLVGGFFQGKAEGRQAKVRAEVMEAQKAYVKAQAKALEREIELAAQKDAVLATLPPEERIYAQFPELAKLKEAENARQTFADVVASIGGPSGAAAPAPAPLPFGGGSQMFPLVPSLSQWTPPSQEAAALTSPRAKPRLTFDNAGKQTVAIEEYRPKIDWVQLPGPLGTPIQVQTADGKMVPGTALDVPVKLEQREESLPDGTKVSYNVNPYTGQPDGGVRAAIPRGPSYRVTSAAPTEEFKFTDTDGVEKSVIRKKQTGEWVTKPVPVAPAKGALASDAGKIEGAQKGIQNVKKIRSMLIDPKTEAVNRGLILKMWAPAGGFGEGRQIKSLFREALDVKIRAMTGAAISKEELPFYESTYLPHPLDDDALVVDKLNRLGEFLEGYQASVDPSGIATERVKKASGGKNAPSEEPKKGKSFKVDAQGNVTEVK